MKNKEKNDCKNKIVNFLKRVFVFALFCAVLTSSAVSASASSFKTESGITEKGDFTLAIVPDTQVISENCPEALSTVTGWIEQNKDAENIRFVSFLGDMTDNNRKSEWKALKSATDLLSVPFSMVNGNRDMNDDADKRDTSRFESTYPLSCFSSYSEFGGAFDGSPLNTYYVFTEFGMNYLILCLEFAPRDEVLEWAGSVVSSHPGHNVIVMTHGYLDDDGSVISSSSDQGFLKKYPYLGGTGNSGDGIRSKLLMKYDNIVLLLCGHRGDGDLVLNTDKTSKGNKILSLMSNGTDIDEKLEGGAGMVLLLHFKAESGTVYAEYYSTVTGKYYGAGNQMALALDTVEPGRENCVIASSLPKEIITIAFVLILLSAVVVIRFVLTKKNNK